MSAQRGQTEQPYQGAAGQAWVELTDLERPAVQCEETA